MRAFPHVRPRVGGVLVLAALAVPALLPSAVPAAAKKKKKSPASLTSVGNPPRTAEAGSSFRLSVKVRNGAKESIRPEVTVRIHSKRSSKGQRIGSKELGRLRAG